MDEYIENNGLPDAIEQKYNWSCQICNIKEALNYLLKTNITEDDLLSKIERIGASKRYFDEIKNDCPNLKVTAPDFPMEVRVEFNGINAAVRSFCGSEVIFTDCFHLHPFAAEKKVPGEVITCGPNSISDFEIAIRDVPKSELEYHIIKELISSNVVLSAGGYRKEINKIDDAASHAFMIKSVGRKDGLPFAKVLDSNYKRRNLAPEYTVPLEKLRVEMLFYKP